MVELPTRHTEAETRRLEDVAWREKARTEDLAEREFLRAEREIARAEDVAWREKARTEDLAEREALRLEREAARVERVTVRAEDVAWRKKVRTEDRAERDASHAQTLECLARGLAFLAAAQNAKPGTPAEVLARTAQDFTQLIIGRTDHR